MSALSGSYAYHPNSALIRTLTFKSGTTTVATTIKRFDALNRLTQLVTLSANGTTPPVSHGYTLNAFGQRTRVDLADGDYWLYGYNAKGEPSRAGSGAVDWPKASPTGDRAAGISRSQHRLVAATSGSTTLSFAYDAQSRRIAKTPFAGTIRFLYDDWTTGAGDGSGEITAGGDPLGDMSGREGVNWNLVAKIDNTNSPIRRHLWGLDLSGSPQDAGGVGGLLATSLASGSAHFMASDGNGNVFATINAADGTHYARFEYNPFGGNTSATGAALPLLPFRFSTKYQNTETGLYYYGSRFYNPKTGWWINRDPIEEEGGVNLYEFVYSNPNDWFDDLGVRPMPAPPRPAPRPGTGAPGGTRPVPGSPGWTMHAIYGPMPPTQPNPNRPRPQPVIQAPDDTEGTQRPHSGEFHVQFGGERDAKIHSRTIWRRNLPLTKSEGTAKLDELWPKLTHDLQQRLRGSFDKARQWIRSRETLGLMPPTLKIGRRIEQEGVVGI